MKFGVHVSISGNIAQSFPRAKKIGCETFQIFTRNPRSWHFKILTDEIICNFKENYNTFKIYPIFSHLPYLPNLASSDYDIRSKSIESLKIELNRCDVLEIPFIVTHLGSTKNEKKEIGIVNVKQALDTVLKDYKGNCKILLENTAGKEQNIGANITDICNIISEIDNSNKVGLCFDTCHAFASGYDLRDIDVVNEILFDIENSIRLEKLLLIHCNDSKSDLGSGIDRHEHLGVGTIGDIGFRNILRDKRLENIPFICETPVDERRNDEGNINYLKKLHQCIM